MSFLPSKYVSCFTRDLSIAERSSARDALTLTSQATTLLLEIQETTVFLALLHEDTVYACEWSEAVLQGQMAEHGFAGTPTEFLMAMLDSLQSQRHPLLFTDADVSTCLTVYAFPEEGRRDPTADHLAIPLSVPLATSPKQFQRIIRLQTQVTARSVEPWETVVQIPTQPTQTLEIQTLDLAMDDIVLDIPEDETVRDTHTVLSMQTIQPIVQPIVVKPVFRFRGAQKQHA